MNILFLLFIFRRKEPIDPKFAVVYSNIFSINYKVSQETLEDNKAHEFNISLERQLTLFFKIIIYIEITDRTTVTRTCEFDARVNVLFTA